MKAERTANAAEETHTGGRAGALVRAILRPGACEPNAGGESRRPSESLRPAPCEPPAPRQKRPARLQAALTRTAAPARHAAAAFLLAFAALLVLPPQAQAQTLTTLVSNTGETLDSGSTGSIVAQNFRTGANADGYTISEVDIRLHAGSGSTSTSVSIRKNTSGEPGDLVAALTNPSPLSRNSLNTFTAPVGTRLDASTTYWITVSEGISNRAPLSLTFSNAQTGEQGWRIGNDRLYRSSDSDDWTTSESALVIAIKGTAGITASTDATLSDLTLTDDDGNAISLTPTFVSVTTSYMASVANRIDAVTLTAATQNDSNAMVAITSDDDTTSPGEAVLPLTVGSNTLTVTVTAEDGSTMETYTVAVTRGVPVPVDIEPNYDTIGAGLEDLVFTLTREGAATDELEATVTIVQDESWLGNSDLSKTVTFVAGSATATLTLAARRLLVRSRHLRRPDRHGIGHGHRGRRGDGGDDLDRGPPITVSYDMSSYTFAEDAADVNIYVLVTLDSAYPRAPSRSFYLSFTSASDTAISPGDYGIISWQPQFVQGDFALDVSKFVARKRLRDTGGAYFGVEDDDVYEGSERLVVILERSPNLPSGLVQFVRPNGDICEALSCSPRVEYPVTITDEEDRPVLSLSADPASIAEEDDDTTTSVTENVSVLTVAAASPKTFATDQAITLTFAGIAVYGTHYSVNPADTDANATGHQVLLPAETASVEVTVTAAANDTDDGHRSILVTGSRDGTAFGNATTIALPDDDTTTTTNTPATGTPSISGTAQVGQTLTASTSDIMDDDGLPASFTYQWVRVDADGVVERDEHRFGRDHLLAVILRRGQHDQGEGELHRQRGQRSEGPLLSDATAAVVLAAAGPCPAGSDWCTTMTVEVRDQPKWYRNRVCQKWARRSRRHHHRIR